MNRKRVLISVEAWGQSDLGRQRDNNEDSFLLIDLTTGAELSLPFTSPHQVGNKGLLLLVADGMGGHEAGEVASRLAIETVSQRLRMRWGWNLSRRQAFVLALQEAIVHANARIYQANQENDRCRMMGTTLTAAGVYDGAVFFAQVGDSRGYLLRSNTIARMTQDQSLVAELEMKGSKDGEQTTKHPLQHVLLQALGPEEQVTIPLSFTELRRGDWVLLCSDGLTNLVTDEEIRDIVSKAADTATACQALIAAANENGGQDNITVVAARCDGPGLSLPTSAEQPRAQEFVTQRWWQFTPWKRRDDGR
jgi:protein phosphatase